MYKLLIAMRIACVAANMLARRRNTCTQYVVGEFNERHLDINILDSFLKVALTK